MFGTETQIHLSSGLCSMESLDDCRVLLESLVMVLDELINLSYVIFVDKTRIRSTSPLCILQVSGSQTPTSGTHPDGKPKTLYVFFKHKEEEGRNSCISKDIAVITKKLRKQLKKFPGTLLCEEIYEQGLDSPRSDTDLGSNKVDNILHYSSLSFGNKEMGPVCDTDGSIELDATIIDINTNPIDLEPSYYYPIISRLETRKVVKDYFLTKIFPFCMPVASPDSMPLSSSDVMSPFYDGQPPSPVADQPSVPLDGQPPSPVADQPSVPLDGQPPSPVADQPSVPLDGQPPPPVADQPSVPLECHPAVNKCYTAISERESEDIDLSKWSNSTASDVETDGLCGSESVLVPLSAKAKIGNITVAIERPLTFMNSCENDMDCHICLKRHVMSDRQPDDATVHVELTDSACLDAILNLPLRQYNYQQSSSRNNLPEFNWILVEHDSSEAGDIDLSQTDVYESNILPKLKEPIANTTGRKIAKASRSSWFPDVCLKRPSSNSDRPTYRKHHHYASDLPGVGCGDGWVLREHLSRLLSDLGGRVTRGLSSGQIDGLSSGQIDGLSSGQIDGLSSRQIDGLSSVQIDNLSSGHIAGLSDGQIDGFSSGKIDGFSDSQMNAEINFRFSSELLHCVKTCNTNVSNVLRNSAISDVGYVKWRTKVLRHTVLERNICTEFSRETHARSSHREKKVPTEHDDLNMKLDYISRIQSRNSVLAFYIPQTDINIQPDQLYCFMHLEVFRLCSFGYSEFPSSMNVFVIRMAKHGYYYERPEVICFACRSKIAEPVSPSMDNPHHPQCTREVSNMSLQHWMKNVNPEHLHEYFTRYQSLTPFHPDVPYNLAIVENTNATAQVKSNDFTDKSEARILSNSEYSSGKSVGAGSTSEESFAPSLRENDMPSAASEHDSGNPDPSSTSSPSSIHEESPHQHGLHQILTSAAKYPMNLVDSTGNSLLLQTESSSEFPREVGVDRSLDLSNASYPQFSSATVRMQTFTLWRSDHTHQPDDLVAAGFFYAGYADCVRCFFCGLGLKFWKPGDIITYQHAKFRPHCVYNRMYKGQDYVDRVQQDVLRNQEAENSAATNWNLPRQPEQTMLPVATDVAAEERQSSASTLDSQDTGTKSVANSISSVQAAVVPTLPVADNQTLEHVPEAPLEGEDPQAEASGIQEPAVSNVSFAELFQTVERENVLLIERTMCRICNSKQVRCIYLPCGHVISCQECADEATHCLFCKKRIIGTASVYLA